MKFSEVTEDTPDQFGNSSPIDFGSATSLTFRPNGILVDNAGNPVNGTVFIGVAEHPEVDQLLLRDQHHSRVWQVEVMIDTVQDRSTTLALNVGV